MRGGGAGVQLRWWWWWGSTFANVGQERGWGPNLMKLSHSGSVSGCIWAAGDQEGAMVLQPTLPW
jgi:hypothetical protein